MPIFSEEMFFSPGEFNDDDNEDNAGYIGSLMVDDWFLGPVHNDCTQSPREVAERVAKCWNVLVGFPDDMLSEYETGGIVAELHERAHFAESLIEEVETLRLRLMGADVAIKALSLETGCFNEEQTAQLDKVLERHVTEHFPEVRAFVLSGGKDTLELDATECAGCDGQCGDKENG